MPNVFVKSWFQFKKSYRKKKFTKKKLNISVFKNKKDRSLLSLFFFTKSSTFKFGSVIIKFTRRLLITQLLYKKFMLLIKRIARKPDRTSKVLWLSPSYIFRVTYKSKGARMGKGQGKDHVWYKSYFPGKPFIEVANVRIGRVFYFLFYLNLWTNNFFYSLSNYLLYFSNIKNRTLGYNVTYHLR